MAFSLDCTVSVIIAKLDHGLDTFLMKLLKVFVSKELLSFTDELIVGKRNITNLQIKMSERNGELEC